MSIANMFEEKSKGIEYAPHKKFKGVYLKHLVTGAMTDNRISCHLVKVDPFCVLEAHTHPEQIEIHEVIDGDGVCTIADKKLQYTPGVVEAVPQGVTHEVVAGKDGIYILAKFVPALL
ncbi:MAG: cupin [Spirochaetota bacterium]|jgi:quercetin dioxygenase-like cupin family protein|nr:cupin [Spirochaetota bacterium]